MSVIGVCAVVRSNPHLQAFNREGTWRLQDGQRQKEPVPGPWFMANLSGGSQRILLCIQAQRGEVNYLQIGVVCGRCLVTCLRTERPP